MWCEKICRVRLISYRPVRQTAKFHFTQTHKIPNTPYINREIQILYTPH